MTGLGRICTRSSGAPTRTNSARISSTVAFVVFQPDGDGAMITALPPLTAIIALLTGVAAGLVDGVTAPTTPTGLAYFTSPFSGISSITPFVLTRIKSRSAPKVLRVFLITLSGTLPSPVFSTASTARRSAFSGL